LLIGCGVVVGVGLGAALTWGLGAFATAHSGLALHATLGAPEVILALGLVAVGSLLAALPSLVALRGTVASLLRLA
jgi:hypothetical protein